MSNLNDIVTVNIDVASPAVDSASFRNFFIKMWEGIKKAFNAVVNWFKGAIANIVAFFQGLWDSIVGIFTGVIDWFRGIFSGAWEAIKGVFAAVGDFFSGIWDTIKGIFTKIGTAIGDAIGGAFRAVVNAIITFAEGIINGFIKAINGAIKLINYIPGVNIKLIAELEIPKLEKGSNSTPDTFIAGDVNGKGGELVTGAKGRKVFTAAETGNILDFFQAFGSKKPKPQTVAAASSEVTTKSINQTNNFYQTFNGDRAGQKKSAEAMGRAADDATGALARGLQFAG
jgi:phage-related protein